MVPHCTLVNSSFRGAFGDHPMSDGQLHTNCCHIWRFPKNGGTRNHPLLWAFHYKHLKTINHPAIGVPPFQETSIYWIIIWNHQPTGHVEFSSNIYEPCEWLGDKMTWPTHTHIALQMLGSVCLNRFHDEAFRSWMEWDILPSQMYHWFLPVTVTVFPAGTWRNYEHSLDPWTFQP